MGDGGESPRNDEERQLEHRRLIELLNELRVALTGVQIMFAFLLTVPFTQRFAHGGTADAEILRQPPFIEPDCRPAVIDVH